MTLEVKENWKWEVDNLNSMICQAQKRIWLEEQRIDKLKAERDALLKKAPA
jgi:hypothetical protein